MSEVVGPELDSKKVAVGKTSCRTSIKFVETKYVMLYHAFH